MTNLLKPLGPQQNFLRLDKEHSSFDASRIVLLPIAYEHTSTKRGGTSFGPQAMIDASEGLELFDEETKREIATEHGLATLSPLLPGGKNDESTLQKIHEVVSDLLNLNKFVVSLGGARALSSAAIAAVAKKTENLSVLQFDAHSNLRDKSEGAKYGDSCVMARVCEFIDPSRVVQVGIRSQSRKEAEYARDFNMPVFYAHEIRGGAYTRFLKYWDDIVVEKLTQHVYVTFDVDAFDPSIMPATITPEPNGLFWIEVMRCLRKVAQKKTIVGFDVVNLAPIKGLRFPEVTAAKLVLKMLNYAL